MTFERFTPNKEIFILPLTLLSSFLNGGSVDLLDESFEHLNENS